jgi:hypothetical protein
MTSTGKRIAVVLGILGAGLAAQTGLEASYRTARPPLAAPLKTLPYTLGDWVGHDEPMDSEILERTQATDYLNRIYEHRRFPGRAFKLWINYSTTGLNLRHSPEVCLPSGGWTKIESLTRELTVRRESQTSAPLVITRLGYAQADLVQGIGFWYYIFGEGRLEQFARSLPISNRSSLGRTTRGSGLTVEVFYPGDFDTDGELLKQFSGAVLDALEPLLPQDSVSYHVP